MRLLTRFKILIIQVRFRWLLVKNIVRSVRKKLIDFLLGEQVEETRTYPFIQQYTHDGVEYRFVKVVKWHRRRFFWTIQEPHFTGLSCINGGDTILGFLGSTERTAEKAFHDLANKTRKFHSAFIEMGDIIDKLEGGKRGR